MKFGWNEDSSNIAYRYLVPNVIPLPDPHLNTTTGFRTEHHYTRFQPNTATWFHTEPPSSPKPRHPNQNRIVFGWAPPSFPLERT